MVRETLLLEHDNGLSESVNCKASCSYDRIA